MMQLKYLATALVLAAVFGDYSVTGSGDTCDAPDPWEAVIEDWATAERSNQTRHGRVMSLPPSQGYYVSDRIDLVPPPPPRQHLRPPPSPMSHRGPYPMQGHSSNHGHHGPPPGSHSANYVQSSYNPPSGPSGQSGIGNSYQPTSNQQSHGSEDNGPPPAGSNPVSSPTQGSQSQQGDSMPYDEWQATPPPPPGAGKIVNRPPNPYKDQFKPSYAYPQAPPSPPPIPVQSADRVDTAAPTPPQKQVSETDLYLLRAIEKLVFRVDLMEKRMRKMEESMHYMVAGAEPKPEPCMSNFTRVGSRCYHFSSDTGNWKSASYACRKLKANLLELDVDERRDFVAGLQAHKNLKGADFWTGGLNPGLLWIWSHSAKPVAANGTADGAGNDSGSTSMAIQGEGRCLALIAAPPTPDYVYRGQDCALRHRYVCEKDEGQEKLSNEIQRVAKSLRHVQHRTPKIAWKNDETP